MRILWADRHRRLAVGLSKLWVGLLIFQAGCSIAARWCPRLWDYQLERLLLANLIFDVLPISYESSLDIALNHGDEERHDG